jgi:hypothetical protein
VDLVVCGCARHVRAEGSEGGGMLHVRVHAYCVVQLYVHVHSCAPGVFTRFCNCLSIVLATKPSPHTTDLACASGVCLVMEYYPYSLHKEMRRADHRGVLKPALRARIALEIAEVGAWTRAVAGPMAPTPTFALAHAHALETCACVVAGYGLIRLYA